MTTQTWQPRYPAFLLVKAVRGDEKHTVAAPGPASVWIGP